MINCPINIKGGRNAVSSNIVVKPHILGKIKEKEQSWLAEEKAQAEQVVEKFDHEGAKALLAACRQRRQEKEQSWLAEEKAQAEKVAEKFDLEEAKAFVAACRQRRQEKEQASSWIMHCNHAMMH